MFRYSFIAALRPLRIVSWCSSIAPSFIAAFSLSLHCPHHSFSSKSLHLRPSLYFTSIQLFLSKTCAPQCKPFLHLCFSAVLLNPLQIRIKHPTERTYRGCTHSLATPCPVSILLVVCSALHHTVVSRLIIVTSYMSSLPSVPSLAGLKLLVGGA